ncbi:hypothetical protein CEXT_568881, partial [Caerostris extrusa]
LRIAVQCSTSCTTSRSKSKKGSRYSFTTRWQFITPTAPVVLQTIPAPRTSPRLPTHVTLLNIGKKVLISGGNFPPNRLHPKIHQCQLDCSLVVVFGKDTYLVSDFVQWLCIYNNQKNE